MDHDPDPDVSVGGEYCDLVVLVGGVEDPKLPLDGPTDVVGDALLWREESERSERGRDRG